MTKNTGRKKAGLSREYCHFLPAKAGPLPAAGQKIIIHIMSKISAGKGPAFLVNTAKKGRPGVSCGGTGAAAPPPFRLGDPAGAPCGSCPLYHPIILV